MLLDPEAEESNAAGFDEACWEPELWSRIDLASTGVMPSSLESSEGLTSRRSCTVRKPLRRRSCRCDFCRPTEESSRRSMSEGQSLANGLVYEATCLKLVSELAKKLETKS